MSGALQAVKDTAGLSERSQTRQRHYWGVRGITGLPGEPQWYVRGHYRL